MSLELTSTYSVITCASCGMHFAVPSLFVNERMNDHKTFYCPSGHRNYYPGKSDCEITKEQNERLMSEINRKSGIIQRLENSKRAYKAHLTIKKKKIAELNKKAQGGSDK